MVFSTKCEDTSEIKSFHKTFIGVLLSPSIVGSSYFQMSLKLLIFLSDPQGAHTNSLPLMFFVSSTFISFYQFPSSIWFALLTNSFTQFNFPKENYSVSKCALKFMAHACWILFHFICQDSSHYSTATSACSRPLALMCIKWIKKKIPLF